MAVAAWKMTVATSLSVKKVESTEFMTIISPANARAAIAELRAMYVQLSDMLGYSLEVALKIAAGISFEMRVEVSNQIPNMSVRIERQPPNRNRFDKLTSAGEELLHQDPVFGEEQNITHEAAHRFRRRQLLDAVLRPLLQEK